MSVELPRTQISALITPGMPLVTVGAPAAEVAGIDALGSSAQDAYRLHEELGVPVDDIGFREEVVSSAAIDVPIVALGFAVGGVLASAVAYRRHIATGVERLFGAISSVGASAPRAAKGPDLSKPATLRAETLLQVLVERPDFLPNRFAIAFANSIRDDGHKQEALQSIQWRDEAWKAIQKVTDPDLGDRLETAFISAMIVQGDERVISLKNDNYLVNPVASGDTAYPGLRHELGKNTQVRSYTEADVQADMRDRSGFDWMRAHTPAYGLENVAGMLASGGGQFLYSERMIDILDHVSLRGRDMLGIGGFPSLRDAVEELLVNSIPEDAPYRAAIEWAITTWSNQQNWEALRKRAYSLR